MDRTLRMGMVGGGPGAFIGEVHRKAARLDGGIISVSVDGVHIKDVDCFSEKENLNALLFDTGELAQGDHVIEVTATGQKNEASSSAQVNLDKFRSYDPSIPVPYKGAIIKIMTE